MSEKHTPGPWRWLGNWLVPVTPAAQAILTYTAQDNGLHGSDADKAVIATAPDLLAAVRAAQALATACMASACYSREELIELARATKPTFDAAIAKATPA